MQGSAGAAQANTLAAQRQAVQPGSVVEPQHTQPMCTVYEELQHRMSFVPGSEGVAAGAVAGSAAGQHPLCTESTHALWQPLPVTSPPYGAQRLQRTECGQVPCSAVELDFSSSAQHTSRSLAMHPSQRDWLSASHGPLPAEPLPQRNFASTSALAAFLPACAPLPAAPGAQAAHGAGVLAGPGDVQWPCGSPVAAAVYGAGGTMQQPAWQPGLGAGPLPDAHTQQQQQQQHERLTMELHLTASCGLGGPPAALLLNEAGYHRNRGRN